jgi:UDP-hydrolysing UDP-N-acetyl-D-glucosamine 2-epimerase
MRRKPVATSKRICFVTGTRAEFGLMRSVLESIRGHRRLKLQIVATGMHLSARHGRTVKTIVADRVVPWRGESPADATGNAVVGLSRAFAALRPDIVLIVGDRVEALAAATAAHLRGIPIAHVHGGDRALGQVDDCLRHAITKLSHIHFPATVRSAQRLLRMGEDGWRVHAVGSPGIDDIRHIAAPPPRLAAEFPALIKRRFALLLLHPVDAEEKLELRRARMVLRSLARCAIDQIVIVYPNNDPGSGGIIRCWREHARGARFVVRRNIERTLFLGLLRDAAMLVGNSSSGIIEAASFGTPVVDIGPRQLGRQRGRNVFNVPYQPGRIEVAIRRIWRDGQPVRANCRNVYGGGGTGRQIAKILARQKIDARLLRKIISY